MRLTRLTLRHFRNLGIQDLELPPEGVAIIGNNAQGKSNLLEAIYYLETFRSFRGARDEQLLAFGEGVFRVSGTLVPQEPGGRPQQVAAAFEKKGKRKKVSVDGVEPDRVSDGLGCLAAVIFSPSDVELVSGGPGERRRFLDIVLSLSDAGYLHALQEFRRVLARRNASLKDGLPGSVVMAWDPALVRSGALVMKTRQDWVAARCGAFREYYSAVSGGLGARIAYRSNTTLGEGATLDEVTEAYREALAAAADRERRTGTTVVGPHRDELLLRLEDEGDDLDLRDYGSGGQRRTAALALRLVEARTIREVRGQEPLILLDDVFAELDGHRSERILDLMEREETGQVVLTAPKESDVRIRKDALPRWRIEAGRINT
ncbi:MAG TPA: DNA replication and repair protein RecF [Longimicrobiales bacterium]|nr:DNA replication and repair protein RecF [Longimicrobiales bacterium]